MSSRRKKENCISEYPSYLKLWRLLNHLEGEGEMDCRLGLIKLVMKTDISAGTGEGNFSVIFCR